MQQTQTADLKPRLKKNLKLQTFEKFIERKYNDSPFNVNIMIAFTNFKFTK